MIGRLTGKLVHIDTDHVMVDVHGVGYVVYVSANTRSQLGSMGDEVTCWIETRLKEDSLTLFGFAGQQEKEWFEILSGVAGVGPRMALALLSACQPDELITAISCEDKKRLTRADGVGPKLANRIIAELKDKAAKMSFGHVEPGIQSSAGSPVPGQDPGEAQSGAANDAISALVNLGYERSEAFKVVGTTYSRLGKNTDVGTLIRESLKEMSA